jgi:Tfp pilus assembly protein PilP
MEVTSEGGDHLEGGAHYLSRLIRGSLPYHDEKDGSGVQEVSWRIQERRNIMKRTHGGILAIVLSLLILCPLASAEESPNTPATYAISDYALSKMKEWEVSEDIMTTLTEMKDQHFSTRLEFMAVLEEIIGKDQTAQYGIRILNASYRYDPTGRREPFESLAQDGSEDPPTTIKESACEGPLGQFHVGEIQIIGILLGGDGDRARVKAPDGQSYTIRMGECLGKFQGKVVTFTENCITIKETQEIQKGDEIIVREPETHLCLDPLEEETVP